VLLSTPYMLAPVTAWQIRLLASYVNQSGFVGYNFSVLNTIEAASTISNISTAPWNEGNVLPPVF
jgi:hypothetical protein